MPPTQYTENATSISIRVGGVIRTLTYQLTPSHSEAPKTLVSQARPSQAQQPKREHTLEQKTENTRNIIAPPNDINTHSHRRVP